jgi:hypothetical protein
MSFRIAALPLAPFVALFALDDAALAACGVRRVIADASPGYPCRVSLIDAAPGERLILLNHRHQPADTPFRAAHAIYVRESATEARPDVNEIPALLRHRTLSPRAFDADGMMRDAALTPGDALLAPPAIATVHIHFAAPGCYAARAGRA